jgi:hypothetical protein
MASFFDVLKKIGSIAFGIEKVAVPIASALDPAFAPALSALDAFVTKIHNSVVTVEASAPSTASSSDKQNAVINDFESGLAFAQQILALEGKSLTYDPAALNTAINSIVAGYNSLAAVKQSFKIVPLQTNAGS